MSSNKQILVIVMAIIVYCSDGYVLRRKRQQNMPETVASFFIDKASEGMQIIEHGAAYKGQQDHQVDFFGAQAGIDAKPKVGFGDAVRDYSSEERRRKKRQSESEYMNNETDQQNQNAQEIHGIFQEMWQTMIEGGKKVLKKVAEMVDRQPPPENSQQY